VTTVRPSKEPEDDYTRVLLEAVPNPFEKAAR
jgi:hypothetical protein